MSVVKCVWQHHDKKSELQPVFDYFRSIANEAIRIGAERSITSRFMLHNILYYKLRTEFHCKYVYGALECAASKLRLFRQVKKKNLKARIPYISKNHLILDNRAYKITDGQIRIPTNSGFYCFIKLNHYVLEQLQAKKLGSITITEEKIVISYSKQNTVQHTTDFVAVDRNLDNATTFDTQNKFVIYDLHKANQIKLAYKQVKSKFRRNDVRIRKKIFAKYGKKEKNRVNQILHVTSKNIARQNMGIILEDLKGIRKLYRKGNGRGTKFRAKMNSWSFYELQRQIEYKARWFDLSVIYVRAHWTSSKCAVCGSKMVPEEHRMLFCSRCNVAVDRDINAAKNILARGTRVVPIGDASEAMVEESSKEVILKVDASQLSCKSTR